MDKQTIRDVGVKGKRVLVRVDLNVPMSPPPIRILDDSRIRAVLPTIRYLRDRGAKVILCTHLGRPKGKVDESFRVAPVGHRLQQLLGSPVSIAAESVGPLAQEAVSRLQEGEVLLLENIRFHPEEEENDPAFAKALASLADIYVNDAFGTAHRAHASTVGVAQYLPAVAGFLMETEITVMGRALDNPVRPLAAVLGGAKVSDKLAVLQNLLDKADSFLIGGGMACTFLKAQGYDVGRSSVEEDLIPAARDIISRAAAKGTPFLLPVDVVASEKIEARASCRIVPVAQVPPDWYIVDIGPQTVAAFHAELQRCKTVIWNGPMGVFEIPDFSQGTRDLVKTLASLDAITIIGGGSTAEAAEEMGQVDKMTHVSTGGGASLMFLEGTPLPGAAALSDKKARRLIAQHG